MPSKTNPKSVVDAEPYNVCDLLGKHEYTIPDYQREFVWKATHVQQLWKDLFEHFKRNTTHDQLNTSPEAYFLGAIVVLKVASSNTFEVIDGQQRLATLTCIASVLLDYLEKIRKQSEEVIGLKSQLTNMIGNFRGGSWRTNVELADADLNKFFLASCLKEKGKTVRIKYWISNPKAVALLKPKKSTAARLSAIFSTSEEEIERFTEKMSGPSRQKRLMSLAQLFLECVVILRIEATSHSTAYDLFESLNYRGLSLSQADLVKNVIIKVASPNAVSRRTVIAHWTDAKAIISALEKITLGMPDFLHYSYLSRKSYIKANKLFDTVKSQVTAGNVVEYAANLSADAEALEVLLAGDFAKWTAATNTMLKDIALMKVSMAYIALFAGYEIHGANKPTFEQFVRMIMNFIFRFMKVLEGDVGRLAEIMTEIAAMARGGKTNTEMTTKLRGYAPDATFIKEFETASFNNAKLSYFVVYYLESQMLTGTVALDHGTEQNLEHIMPKTPKKKYWPAAYAIKQSDADKFRDYLWRVGNLIPLTGGINRFIQNKAIAFKIANSSNTDYSHCTLSSPKTISSLLDSGEWTLSAIEKRQKILATTYAAKAWAL